MNTEPVSPPTPEAQVATEPPVTAAVGRDPTDPTYFFMRYPKLSDLLYRSGIEGVEYCLVAGHNQARFTRTPDGDGKTWSAIQGLPPLTIEGPKGVADTVILMGKGTPIPGSDDHNGIRKFGVDIDVEETTGLPANPDSPLAITNNTKDEAGAPSKGKKQEGSQ